MIGKTREKSGAGNEDGSTCGVCYADDLMHHREHQSPPPAPQAISIDGFGIHFRLSEHAYLAGLDWLERHEVTILVFGVILAILKAIENVIVRRDQRAYEAVRTTTRQRLDKGGAGRQLPPGDVKRRN